MGLFDFAKMLKLTPKVEGGVSILIFTKGKLFYLIGFKRQRQKLAQRNSSEMMLNTFEEQKQTIEDMEEISQ